MTRDAETELQMVGHNGETVNVPATAHLRVTYLRVTFADEAPPARVVATSGGFNRNCRARGSGGGRGANPRCCRCTSSGTIGCCCIRAGIGRCMSSTHWSHAS